MYTNMNCYVKINVIMFCKMLTFGTCLSTFTSLNKQWDLHIK